MTHNLIQARREEGGGTSEVRKTRSKGSEEGGEGRARREKRVEQDARRAEREQTDNTPGAGETIAPASVRSTARVGRRMDEEEGGRVKEEGEEGKERRALAAGSESLGRGGGRRSEEQRGGGKAQVTARAAAEGARDSGEECVMCMAASKSFICMPCMHVCLCATCAVAVRESPRQCPVCRTATTQILRVYL